MQKIITKDFIRSLRFDFMTLQDLNRFSWSSKTTTPMISQGSTYTVILDGDYCEVLNQGKVVDQQLGMSNMLRGS